MALRASGPKNLSDEAKAAKNARIRASALATRQRHRQMVCQVRDLKLVHPSATQARELRRLFLEAKWLRNAIIASGRFDRDYLKELGTSVPVRLPGGEVEDRSLEVIGSQIRQSVLAEVKANRKALAASKENGRRVGALRFTRQVCSIDLQQFGNTHKINMERRRVKIQNITGWIKVRGLGQLSPESEIANAKLLHRPDGYHLMVTVYTPPQHASGRQTQTYQPGTMVGVDMGSKTHFTLSNGTKINASVEQTGRLVGLQRKLARQHKGSASWRKTRHQLQREYQKLVNRRNDAANKIVHELLKNETIVIQDEHLRSWAKRDGYARMGHTITTSVLGRVKHLLSQHERVIVLPSNLPTTARCVCGTVTKHHPSQRTYTCPKCGYSADRDIHAAQNMVRMSVERTQTPAESRVRPAATMNFMYLAATGYATVKQEAASSSVMP